MFDVKTTKERHLIPNWSNEYYSEVWKDVEKKTYLKSRVFSDKDILGEYSSRERALEVLDEIQKFMEAPLEYRANSQFEIYLHNKTVYEMPKE